MKYSELDQNKRQDLFRRALANGDIDVHYQPFVNAICQAVTGFEALARWETKEFGKVSPGEFLPVVESCGLVDEFCAYVLQSACHAASQWQKDTPNLRVAVNVSRKELCSEQFVPSVERALRRTSLRPESLDLELTEATLTSDPVVTEDRVAALMELGVNIVLDDFGTGKSSLGGLKTASFERVKIDRSFVNGLDHDHADQAIVKAIVNLCSSMKLHVVAVGVETPVQEDILSELGCYEVQGFLHARPMSKEEVGPFLRVKNSAAARRQRCA